MTINSINEPLDPARTARTPTSINEPPEFTMPEKPEITGYDPYDCTIGDPDFTLVVSGTGFYPQSVIHFAGHDEPTTLTEDGTLTTGVKPSLWLAPATVQLSIFNGPVESNVVEFVFNDVGGAEEETDEEALDDPDAMEEEIEAAEEDGDFKPTHGDAPARAKPKPKAKPARKKK